MAPSPKPIGHRTGPVKPDAPKPDVSLKPDGVGAERLKVPAIQTEGLSRSFDDRDAVVDLTFSVEPGEVVALLGPNGAGKTTTMRLLNGVLAPDRGWSRVLGLDPAVDGTAVRSRTGVLTEHAGLDERLTALENLVVTGRMRSMPRAALPTKAAELLDRLGMGDLANVPVRGFSTGQRKRVALARALLHEPQLLFLDEPTSGLDPAATREVVDLIATLAGQGTTVLLCTHFLGEAGRLADRMAVLWKGRLKAYGTPGELAATLWQGLTVELEVADGDRQRALDAAAGGEGVIHVAAQGTSGITAVVADRSVVPALLRSLHDHGVPVFAATPRTPSLEDVYFAVMADVDQQIGVS